MVLEESRHILSVQKSRKFRQNKNVRSLLVELKTAGATVVLLPCVLPPPRFGLNVSPDGLRLALSPLFPQLFPIIKELF